MAADKSKDKSGSRQSGKSKRGSKSQSSDNPEARQEFIDRRNTENSIFPRDDLSE